MRVIPRKSLGQNFLKDREIARRIVVAADLGVGDLVLEIGPGKGIITEELVKKAGKVVAIEIDKNLVEYLKNKFKDNENVEIVSGDILKMDFNEFAKEYNFSSNYKVVANIPFYITSLIIRFFLENELPPKEMILMVQREVAERIVASPGEHSILSLSVQYYAKPELLFYVNKNNFDPVPEVDSAVIKILVNGQRFADNKKNSEEFFRVVRAGFCAKRKTLANNLSNSFHIDKEEVKRKFKTIPLSGTVRAQELDIGDWIKIMKLFH